MNTRELTSQVTLKVSHERREVSNMLARDQEMKVITQHSDVMEFHAMSIEVERSREHSPNDSGDLRSGFKKRVSVNTTIDDVVRRPRLRLIP